MRLQDAITPEQMVSMTAKVRLDRKLESEVAAGFLRETLKVDIPKSVTVDRSSLLA